MTQNQLIELLETEGARALLDIAEERGWIEPAEPATTGIAHEAGSLERARPHAGCSAWKAQDISLTVRRFEPGNGIRKGCGRST